MPLRVDVPSPLAPRNDVEEGKDDEKDEGQGEGRREGQGREGRRRPKEAKKDEAKPKEPPKPVEIDLAGFEERLVVLPPAPGNYDRAPAASRASCSTGGSRARGPDEEKSPLVFYDLKEREEKTVLGRRGRLPDRGRGREDPGLARRKDFAIIEPKPDQKMEKKLATSELEMTVDPVAEWRQIFNDAWRFERDYFYDPDLHGVDWNEMRQRYGRAARRTPSPAGTSTS